MDHLLTLVHQAAPHSFLEALANLFIFGYFVNALFFFLSLSFGFIKFWILPEQYKKQYEKLDVSDWPGISIIKPLTGVDPSLRDNLLSFFSLDYPKYELLFCIQDPNDEAIPLVKRIIAHYPSVDARLFIGGAPVGVNPKINNMTPAYVNSKYKWFLIADTGIWMRNDTLKDMMYCALREDRVGIVHQCPFYRLPTQAGFFHKQHNAFYKQCVFFATWHLKLYLALNCFGINCATGMCSLYRRDVLDNSASSSSSTSLSSSSSPSLPPSSSSTLSLGKKSLSTSSSLTKLNNTNNNKTITTTTTTTSATNGLAAYGEFLAEDFFMAETYIKSGWRIRMSQQPAFQNPGYATRELFRSRMDRWFQLRLSMMPFAALVEPVFECFPSLLLTIWSIHMIWPSTHLITFAALHCFIWFLLDYGQFLLISYAYPKQADHTNLLSLRAFAAIWFEQELTSLPLRIKALWQPHVHWRGRNFKLAWGGKAIALPTTTTTTAATAAPAVS